MKQINKYFFLLFILCVGVCSTNDSFAQDWQWAKSAGGVNNDYGQSVITDASGNIYVAGGFGSPSITFGATTLTNAGVENIFLVKYDASGNVIWAKSAGGTGTDQANSVTIDASGFVYVAGFFSSPTVTFGTTTLPNAGGNDIFLVKYNSAGNVIWARSAGGTDIDNIYSVSTDATGGVYVAGSFSSSSFTLGATTLTNMGSNDMFIAKYDSSGNVAWARSAGGSYSEIATSVVTDVSGKVYVAGYYNSNSITFGTHTLTNPYPGVCSIFLVKYDANGNVVWANRAGGNGYDNAASITTDKAANIFIAGFFEGGAITFGTTTLTTFGGTGSSDAYVAKYDSSGNALWAKSVGGTGTEFANAVTADTSGNVYVAGIFDSHFITIGASTFTNADTDYYDLFLVKYNTSGSMEWAKNGSGAFNDFPNSVSADKSGNVYVTGNFNSDTLTFGTIMIISPYPSFKMFLAKLSSTTGIPIIAYSQNKIAIYPNPATKELTITSTDKITQVTISNLLGQVVASPRPSPKEREVLLNVADLPAGVYFVKINGSEVRKFVKE